MTELSETPSCSNPDCEVALNGSCLEGHDPIKSCPHFGRQTSDTAEPESSEVQTVTETKHVPETPKVQLPQGESLSQLDVDAQQLQRPGRLVAIIGDTSSGKSTLLCSLYDKFLRGEFAERSFVGSTTLGGFEKLAHLSRAASGARAPDTVRTFVSEGLQYYHLALSNEVRQRVDLFVSDRAGETYRSAMDRPHEFGQLPELSVARIVTVLIDGTRLAKPEELHDALGVARRMVRAMVDSQALNDSQHLQLVMTKHDEVERSGYSEAITSQLTSLIQRLERDFGAKLATIRLFKIAARDPDGDFEPGHGCSDLLSAWCDAVEPTVQAIAHGELPATQFDRLAHVVQGRVRN